MTTPASDCATHNGPAVESNFTLRIAAALRVDACNYRTTASRETVSTFAHIFTQMAEQRTRWADAIEAQATALRTARALIASIGPGDAACVGDRAGLAAIAEYDVVLAQIDEVLRG
jgi:hypothetical protein